MEAYNNTNVSDEAILRTTGTIYLPLFFGVATIFCIARQHFHRVYNVRGGWLPRLHSPLAEKSYGYISWMWKLYQIPNDDMLKYCGMDALCLIRAQHQGLKLSCLGILLSIFLFPTYAMAPNSENTSDITDTIVQLTVAHVPEASNRLLATVVAAYILYGTAMYFILQEFQWFTQTRVQFLVLPTARNYTVYVSQIRPAYRSDAALREYFTTIFGQPCRTRVARNLPRLEQLVESRRGVLEKLEHAINIQQLKGEIPQHRTLMGTGDLVDSIPYYQEKLNDYNSTIAEAIEQLEQLETEEQTSKHDVKVNKLVAGRARDENEQKDESVVVIDNSEHRSDEDVADQQQLTATSTPNDAAEQPQHLQESTHIGSVVANVAQTSRQLSDHTSSILRGQASSLSTQAAKVSSAGQGAVTRGIVPLIPLLNSAVKDQDGEPLCSGFVTFQTLSATTVSKQMLHSNTPFEMEVDEAPAPEGIVWGNVGRPHESIHMGRLISFGIVTAICLFWTIPVSFLVSLTEVEHMKERFETLEEWTEQAPWLESVLQQVGPILLWTLTELLYVVLDIVVKLEGHIGASTLEASLFVKLSAFHIIQTFFVASLAGSLSATASTRVDDLLQLLKLLSTTLPPQSTFFIQYLLASTVIGLTFEMIRITQIWQEQLRKRVWWSLTDKEANKKFKFLRPLGDPRNFFHARVFAADTILPFMICFVYTPLAPLTCYFLAFCFLVQATAFRHQFVYIYPAFPDSGGRLWMSSVHVIIVCMLAGEITLCVYLVLKKAPVAAPLMIPLIIITILFAVYVQQRHFHAAHYLSSEDCLHYDAVNAERGVDFGLVQDQYRNPALMYKELQPDNVSPEIQSSVNGEDHSEE